MARGRKPATESPGVQLVPPGQTVENAKRIGPIYCAKHHYTHEPGTCGCPPGWQVRALQSTAREILAGGGRGGGKTELGRIFLLKGNPHEPQDCPTNQSYINNPKYRALVIRKNQTDLLDWIKEAEDLFNLFGAKFYGDTPMRFVFPKGATFVLGHLDTKDAYQKYQGQEFVRIIPEEVGQIPDERLYLQVLGSLRTTEGCRKGCKRGECRCGRMDVQVYATANPGGPGHLWLTDRFIKAAPEGQVFVQPDSDPAVNLTRVYFHSGPADNPMVDPAYLEYLRTQLPPDLRQAWYEGSWEGMVGRFFPDYRAKHKRGEPDNAVHEFHSLTMFDHGAPPAWWQRWGGFDWGYSHDSAILGFTRDPSTGRIIAEKEWVGRDTGSFDLGVLIGRMWLSEIMSAQAMGVPVQVNVFCSPDAWWKRDDTTVPVTNIREGVEAVLGAGLAHLEENAVNKTGIVLRKANNNRVAAADHIRELLNWRDADLPEFSEDVAQNLRRVAPWLEDRYRTRYETATKPRVKPGLAILADRCPELARTLPLLTHDSDTPEDVKKTKGRIDDVWDACRYALHSENLMRTVEPQCSYVQRRMMDAKDVGVNMDDINVRIQVLQKARLDYDKSHSIVVPKVFGPRLRR